ncbi:RNA-binding protein, partial [Mycolicibacterium monacense DSM 44395]
MLGRAGRDQTRRNRSPNPAMTHYWRVRRMLSIPGACAVALVFAAGLTPIIPTANATVCGSVGGRHVDISGCSDPFAYLNEALPPPPP